MNKSEIRERLELLSGTREDGNKIILLATALRYLDKLEDGGEHG